LQVEVLFFAALREHAGTARLVRSIAPGTTAAALVESLRTDHPSLPPPGPALRIAVNEEFVPPATVLGPGDVVALLPPVSGG